MKHFKSVLAMLLALVMILSCVGGAFAADKTEVTEIAGSKGSQAVLKEAKGFKSEKFQANNTYKYADDEVVRAIVVLEGSPEADVAERSTTKAANTRAKLQNQHANVRKAMSGIDYEIAYEFTTLLNGFSCDVAYGDLDKIADIDGVEAVYIANSYAAPELETSDKKVMVSNNFTGNYQAMGNGFDGAGMVIAVLDTGLLTTHEAFQDALKICEKTGALTEDDLALAVAPGVYINGKVPFAYDYADKDADVTDNNGHGTHVSGIATGYAADPEEGAITFCGASPAAQLLAMKIFHDDEPGTTSDIYFYALEDAYRLGADVINMSIGSQNGFTYDAELETEVFGNIYDRLDKAGVILSVAAGNEYSMAQYSAFAGYIGPEYPDYGTVASPSTYEGNTSVASLENLAYPSYVIAIGEESFSYIDSSDDQLWLNTFANTETEFVVVPDGEGGIALGTPEDFEAVDVTGKIAVVQRGEISFQEKVDNAAAAGAKGCIVVNNQPGVISMAIDPFAIPAISVQQDAAESFLNAESAVVVTPEEKELVANPDGGSMSDFSNWGTSPMLTLDPTMTSFGGRIYSSVNTGDSDYDVYSGTSMAAPNMTGTFSNVLSYLAQNYPELSKAERAERAEALLEGTARVLYDEDGYPYSVRKQGAGLGNAWDAIEALRTTAYITDPLKELGDDPEKTGEYVFDVTFTNDSESDAHYIDSDAYVLMDYVANANTEDDPIYVNTLTSDLVYGKGGEDDHAEITYTVKGEEVTEFDVAAGESVTVTVSIVLDDAIKAYFDEMFKNGTYVEGFVFFDQTDAETGKTTTSCHATFLAFYGDWTQAPILEQADFRDFLDADYYVNTTVVDEDGNTLADYGDTALDYLDYYTSPNMGYTLNTSTQELFYYLGGNILDYEPFVESHISFSTPETDGTYYYADAFYLEPYQLRNARHLIMTVADAETGEVYYVDDTEYLPKAVYDVDAQDWLATGSFMWDGTDADGNYVPSGTVAHVQFDAVLPYSHDEAEDGTLFEDVWSFDVTVDYTAPVIESVVFDPEAETLTVTASDEQYLQAIYLADYEYEILDYATFSSDVAGESFTATFDVSGLIADGMDSVVVTALDYATNENDAMAYFFEVGADATITLVTPDGTVEVPVVTGDTYTFEACEATVEDAEFFFWVDCPVESADEISIWDTVSAVYFEGTEILVTGDMTVYACYGVGEYVPLEKANYWYNQAGSDYTGDWALVGLNYVDGYDSTNPNALGADLEKIAVADLDDAEIGDDYVEFYTNDLGVRFTVEHASEDTYTICSAKTGKYLAVVSGALALVDEADASAEWYIEDNEGAGNGTLITSAAAADMVLVYNEDTEAFELMDNTEVYYSDLFGDYYPGEWFTLWMYTCDLESFEVDHFTTELCNHSHTEIRDAVAAGCEIEGYTGDTYCTDCGALVEEGSAIPATGHNWDAGEVTKPATCTEEGVTTYHCADCDKTKEEPIAATGHIGETEIKDVVPAGCETQGYSGNTYCADCGALLAEGSVIAATGHNWDAGVISKPTTCTEDGTRTYLCANCGQTRVETIKASGHIFGDWVVTKPATAAVEGEQQRTCAICGFVETAEIDALGYQKCYVVSFDDCGKTWYHEAIDFAVANGLMNGVANTKFDPEGTMSRAMVVTALYREAGEPEVTAPSTFTDVAEGQWYSDAIAWAQDTKVVDGVAADKFAPNDDVTREQLATILWRYSGRPEAKADLSKYEDADEISAYALTAMNWAVEQGIFSGDNGKLKPTANATRAEFATMLMRFLGGSYECDHMKNVE